MNVFNTRMVLLFNVIEKAHTAAMTGLLVYHNKRAVLVTIKLPFYARAMGTGTSVARVRVWVQVRVSHGYGYGRSTGMDTGVAQVWVRA